MEIKGKFFLVSYFIGFEKFCLLTDFFQKRQEPVNGKQNNLN